MLLALLHLAPLISAGSSVLDPAPGPHPQEAPQGGGWVALETFATAEFGERGLEAARFLRQHRPERDAALSAELLTENLRLALEARARFPWA